MIEVRAPGAWSDERFSIFLAGSIDMGSARDWQRDMLGALTSYSVTVLNPRRDDWDSSWVQAIDNEQFREQVCWEQRGLAQADLRVFVFTGSSKSPITLLELGQAAGLAHGRAPIDDSLICCEPQFYRRGNVEIVAKLRGLPIYESVHDLVLHLRTLLDAKGLRHPNVGGFK